MSKYKVIGPRRVADVDPGGTVEIDDDDLAAYLTAAGHIAAAVPKPNKAPAGETER
jgi:hypothetical protein